MSSYKEFMDILFNQDFCKGPPKSMSFLSPPPPRPQTPKPVEEKKKLGTDYVKELQDEDDEFDRQMALIKLNLDDKNVENPSSMEGQAFSAKSESERLTYIYEKYSFRKTSDNDLHINEYKQLIIENVAQYPVNIIKGHTGCGKTTQVPQFILDECRNKDIHCNIVVAQPTRIAAISLAKRVCEERKWKLGSLVGYHAGLDKVASEETRLMYCTTGILLQKLVTTQDTSMYTHIIVDDVHERNCETDFLLIILKRLMRIKGIDSKIILMSATVNTDKFAEYFAPNKYMAKRGVPVTELTGETRFHVPIFYLDSFQDRLPIKLPLNAFDKPQICAELYEIAASLIYKFNNIDIQEDKVLGSVLIFLPGLVEIEKMFEILRNKNSENPLEEWIICTLYSSLTCEEQSKVFEQPPKGVRKIILSTSLAESSITVPYIKYVVDFCLTKIQVQKPDMQYDVTLQTSWVSKTQGKQLEGRVGRVMPGRVYKIVTEHFYKALPVESTPEILTCPLDTLVVRSKQFNMGSPTSILGRALDPPDLDNIQRTILDLKASGALLKTSNGCYKEDDGDLTIIGHIMVLLPIDPHLSKLVVFGHMFGCFSESIIMACAMSVRSFMSNPFKKELDAYSARLAWSDGVWSDPIAFLNIYSVRKQKFRSGVFPNNEPESESEWARTNYVQVESLHEVFRLEKEVHVRLRLYNISVDENLVKDWRTNKEKASLLKIILAGAAYPHYFSQRPVDIKEADRTLYSNNPCNTVYVTNFPSYQPGPLYTQLIKEYFKQCGSGITLSFDNCKVYGSFESSINSYDNSAKMQVNNKVMTAVYRAIKMRQLGVPMHIPILPSLEAEERAKKIFGVDTSLGYSWTKKKLSPTRPKMPGFGVNVLRVCITHIDSPHSFWAIFTGEDTTKRQTWIKKGMKNKDFFVPLSPCEIQRGVEDRICVVPYTEDGCVYYYRAKIICIFRSRQLAKVQFIDYGHSTDIEIDKLLDFNLNAHKIGLSTEPALAVHCSLAEIEPSVKMNPNGFWSENSTSAFIDRFDNINAIVRVYSVVNDVVNVYLFDENEKIEEPNGKTHLTNSFNYHLITKGYAQHGEETYLSKNDNAARQSPNPKTGYDMYPNEDEFDADLAFESPTFDECEEKVNLKGPYSPLESLVHCLTKKKELVSIEFNSVNSVLLDSNMMDSKRLIVASSVTQNNNSGHVTLHNTTLMPAVPGLHSLIPMIFAPRVELRVNKRRSAFIGALCGLGFDEETNLVYHQENDMEIEFDAEIDRIDIHDINRIRYWMNYMIATNLTSSAMYSVQRMIQELTLKLITRTRSIRNYDFFEDSNEWGRLEGKIEYDYLLKPHVDHADKLVFTLIDSLILKKESLSLKDAMTEHLKELMLYAEGIIKLRGEITYILCQHLSPDARDLKAHLKSSIHRTNFAYFVTS